MPRNAGKMQGTRISGEQSVIQRRAREVDYVPENKEQPAREVFEDSRTTKATLHPFARIHQPFPEKQYRQERISVFPSKRLRRLFTTLLHQLVPNARLPQPSQLPNASPVFAADHRELRECLHQTQQLPRNHHHQVPRPAVKYRRCLSRMLHVNYV